MSQPLLHERVARRWSRARRTTAAAVLAAVASVAALALAVPTGVHALAVVVAAVVGLAWPQRDRKPEALRWIGARVGLAYETAVEAEERSDPFGLFDAVRTQGRLAIRDVGVPQPSPWWLPAALLAATLWAWGAFVGVPWTAPWGPAGSAPGAPSPSPVAPPAVAEPADAPPTEEAPATDPSAARSDEASTGSAGGEGGASDGSGADGSASERDALERFVEGLREREDEPAAAAAAADAADGADEPQRTEGAERGDGDEADARDPDPGGDGEPTDGEASDGDGEGEERAGEEGEETGEGEDPGQADAPGDGTPQDAGDPAAEGEEGAQAGAAGIDPGEDPGDAGLGAGAEGDASDAVAEDPRAPDALPSILGAGPETPIGGVALPGAEGEQAFPEGAAGASFRRAVEEALTEGEVPVSYQEVIRNYFR